MDDIPHPALVLDSEDAVRQLRSAATALTKAETRQEAALANVREAVAAARLMKVPWERIARELGVTRQAAADRFGGKIREELVRAWNSIEVQLTAIARARGIDPDPDELLRRLSNDGALPENLVQSALRLHQVRNTVVHRPGTELSVDEAEELTDTAIPLNGLLWMLANSHEAGAHTHRDR
ncbi:MAG TPA: hypothetical protein VFZ97_19665 [Acidimicrobiales bacterium]